LTGLQESYLTEENKRVEAAFVLISPNMVWARGKCCYCIETTRPTTHDDPIYIVDDVVHYCVANMPGMYPRTSTMALSNATLPYALKLANLGYKEALKKDEALRKGLSVFQGKVTDRLVAEALGLEYTPYEG